MPAWVRFVVEMLSGFIITAGGVLTGYMVHEGAAVLPSKAAVFVAVIGGAIAAANQARAYFAAAPGS